MEFQMSRVDYVKLMATARRAIAARSLHLATTVIQHLPVTEKGFPIMVALIEAGMHGEAVRANEDERVLALPRPRYWQGHTLALWKKKMAAFRDISVAARR